MKDKVAETFDEIEIRQLPESVVHDPYINAFAEKLMHLSNRLNEAGRDDWDIAADYLPAIREFIANITGL